ncbi:hypothetical protein J6590_055503 [Homalodisca vitripennis]|nr:hypothetical protein J6590_055503 [Homalodisca vitripennis]
MAVESNQTKCAPTALCNLNQHVANVHTPTMHWKPCKSATNCSRHIRGWVLQGPPPHPTVPSARTVRGSIAPLPTCANTSSTYIFRPVRTSGTTAPSVARSARPNTTSSTTSCRPMAFGSASPTFSETSSKLCWLPRAGTSRRVR